jgi:hypothetical protein
MGDRNIMTLGADLMQRLHAQEDAEWLRLADVREKLMQPLLRCLGPSIAIVPKDRLRRGCPSYFTAHVSFCEELTAECQAEELKSRLETTMKAFKVNAVDQVALEVSPGRGLGIVYLSLLF